jgi:hypothetical protein
MLIHSLAVEVSGDETIHEFRSILAFDFGFTEEFVLACRAHCLRPLDDRTLKSLDFISDLTTMSVQKLGGRARIPT